MSTASDIGENGEVASNWNNQL